MAVPFAVSALHGVIQNVVGNLNAGRLAVITRRSEMNAGKDAGFLHFFERNESGRPAPVGI